MASINWSLSPTIAIAQKQPNTLDDDIRRIGAIIQALGNERRLKEEQAEQKKTLEERWKKAFDLQEKMYDSIYRANLANLSPEERYWLEEADRYNALGIKPKENYIAPGYERKIIATTPAYIDGYKGYGVK